MPAVAASTSNAYESERAGLELVFEEHGPGIEEVAVAMRDGYSSGHGLGLGLGGARYLVDDFELTKFGEGITISIISWSSS